MEQIPWYLAPLRDRSRLVLGSTHRLPVLALAATLPEDELYAAHVAGLAKMQRKDAVRILRDLQTAALLQEGQAIKGSVGRPGHGLARVTDDVWSLLEEMAEPFRR
jgi:hypothetical protein